MDRDQKIERTVNVLMGIELVAGILAIFLKAAFYVIIAIWFALAVTGIFWLAGVLRRRRSTDDSSRKH